MTVDDSHPILAIISFQLLPGCCTSWLEAWRKVRDTARDVPACRRFDLLHNRLDEAEYAAFTEWDSAMEFDAFVRDAGFTRIDRCMDTVCMQPRYTPFQEVPDETQGGIYPPEKPWKSGLHLMAASPRERYPDA